MTTEQKEKPINHVTEDEHYTEDWTEIQNKLDEIQKKHNRLVKFLVENRHPELLIEFEE